MKNNRYTFAKMLTKQAGKIMLKYFYSDLSMKLKSDVTPLTIAHTKINELVKKTIHAYYSNDSIILEEGSNKKRNQQNMNGFVIR